MATWHTPDTVRAEWEDAEQIADDLLAQLVTAARDAVTAYAPALPPILSAGPVTVENIQTEEPYTRSLYTFTRSGDVVTVTAVVSSPTWDVGAHSSRVVVSVPAGFRMLGGGYYSGPDWRVNPNWSFEPNKAEIGARAEGGKTVTRTISYSTTDALLGGEQQIPDRYRLAQLMQVRNLWNAQQTAPSGEYGGETFAITPRPLDWHVKALLRPQRGRPRVG